MELQLHAYGDARSGPLTPFTGTQLLCAVCQAFEACMRRVLTSVTANGVARHMSASGSCGGSIQDLLQWQSFS